MGYHFKIFPLLIIIFIIISFCCSHFLTFNAEEYLHNGQGPKEAYFMDSSTSLRYIEKVSGEHENEVKESLFFDRFRFLLGIRSIHRGKSENEFGTLSPSPSPAPSIAGAPAPSPALPRIHRHTHHSKLHHHLMPAAHKVEEKDRGKAGKIIAAGVVSATIVFLLCGAGIFWGCQRFKNQRKKSDSYSMSVLRGKSKYATSSLNSVKKISSDPEPDMFYLDSIGVALESEPFRVHENVEIASSKNHSEREDLTVEAIKNQESENDDTSSIGEIVSVHEAALNNGSENHHIVSVDEMTKDNVHTSEIEDDDESFHSFSDSASAKIRLSNASAGSYYSDNAEILSPKMSQFSIGSSSQRSFQEIDSVSIQVTNQESHIQSGKPIIPQPPPPPPSTLLSIQSSSNTSFPRKRLEH
ncbi:hypothetical protein Leryth_025658 [Lithospermum erythrorhizon]|nr:hypothetical protein Leryth_025658 [Lithospermum erythrorhizon]